jgi:uncharacterized protein YjbI with pentapeptide repeats
MDPFNFPSIVISGHQAPSETPTSSAVDIPETDSSQIELLQTRPNDFSNPDLKYPDFFKSLSQESKEEFKNLWDLTQSIESNPNAHKIQNGDSKRFITTGPLQLNSFFSEIKNKNISFSLENFLKENNISLIWAFLENAQLNQADLNHAKLNIAQLYKAKLNYAKLNSAQLYKADLNLTELNYAELYDAELGGAQLNGAQLNSAQLDGARLNGAQLNCAQLDGAELNGAQLNSAQLDGARLYGAKLNGAKLNHARLYGAKLNGAELNNAQLNSAKLDEAKLNGAKLDEAKLNGAQLNGAELNNITISNHTKFNEYTSLKNIKLDSLLYTDKVGKVTQYRDQEEIIGLFVQLGAKSENISFAQAA